MRVRNRRVVVRSISISTVAALAIGALAASGTADAVQAPGHDAAAWPNGWSWTYATVFHYVDSSQGTDVTIDENVTYTNNGPTTFDGQSAYGIGISGTITGGSGSAQVSGVGKVSLKSFSGSVSGTEYLRRSDLAMIQQNQHQQLHATASVSIVSAGVDATIDMTLTPHPTWKSLSFPLNPGDSWHENTSVDYSGGFSYTSSLANGSAPFDGTFPFQATASASSQTINVPINSSAATDFVAAATSDGSTVDNQWWSPTYKNLAREFLQVPLDTATLTIDRKLASVSTPNPATTVSETITPSLTCAGADVTVSGALSSLSSGVPLTVTLDEGGIGPNQTRPVTSGTNGAYSATLTAPAQSDGLAKNGARATWGVLVDGGGAHQVATLVVSPQDCTQLAYTGTTSAPQGGTTTVSAQLTDLANQSNAAGRTITFALSNGASTTATTNGSGLATATLPVAGPPRAATVTASLAATSTLAAASTSATFTVTTDPTTTAVVASLPSVTVGDPVTFTATVTPVIGAGAPTGTVQFVVDDHNFAAPVALSGGSATSPELSSLALGSHTVVANYSGDPNFAPSTSPAITVKVHAPLAPTTTTLALDPDTAVYGQPVTATATVAPKSGGGSPTGTVTFTAGARTLGTAALTAGAGGDQASITLPSLPVGEQQIIATYSGDDTFNASASTAGALTVTQATGHVVLSTPDTSTVTGQAVNYTAAVSVVAPGSGTATGTVVLRVDGQQVGDAVPLDGGSAIFPPVTSLTAGPHTVAAEYSGDDNVTKDTDSLTQTVSRAATATTVTTTPAPSAEDQTVTITADVTAQAPGSGTPTGPVSFTSDGDPIGAATLDASGAATLQISTLAVGSHSIVATYGSDADYLASTSEAVSQTVLSGQAQATTTTTVSSSEDPATFGELISFTAQVSADDSSAGTPRGTVQFSVDGTDIGDAVPLDDSGSATSVTLAAPDPGDHTVIAAFEPAAGFAASGDFLVQTVTDASVHTTLVSSDQHSTYGHAVHFTATVASTQVGTGKPTGVVQFRVDGQPLGGAVQLVDGVATSQAVSDLSPNEHTVTALYSGDVDFAPDLATLTQTVSKIATSTTVSVQPDSVTYGSPVSLTAVVTPAETAFGAPTGTITFAEGTTTLGVVPAAADGNTASASLTLSAPPAGSHTVTATYSGSAIFAGSTSTGATFEVAKAPTTLTTTGALVRLSPLGLPLGQLKAVLASANGPVSGMPIVFTIGRTTVCTSITDASGQAVCNAGAYLLQLVLNNGYHATFTGDADYLPSTSAAGIIK